MFLRGADADEREPEAAACFLHCHALLSGLVLWFGEYGIVGERFFKVPLARGPVFRVDVFFCQLAFFLAILVLARRNVAPATSVLIVGDRRTDARAHRQHVEVAFKLILEGMTARL